MSHKLEINMKTEPDKVLARSTFDIIFSIKNIDNVPFQGHISKINIRFPNSMYPFTEDEFPSIPRINPGNTITLPSIKAYSSEKGVSWISLQLRTNDGQNASHYLGNEEKGNEWVRILYIHDPDNAKIISLLEQVLEEIKKLTIQSGGS